jgi:AraC-like DNA-binding protein
MSKYYFAKSFRRVTGVPPHRYLVTMRMEKARKLLEDPALTLEEVARRVGYADQAHFSEQFRKVIGANAKHYREGPTAPFPAGRNCGMVGNGLRRPEWTLDLPVTSGPMIYVEATATNPVSIRS